MLPQSNLDRPGFPRRASPTSTSCSPHPFLPSSSYLLFIIPFLRDYILLMWDGAAWTFHIPSEFLRTSQVTTAFLITSSAQPSCISYTLEVYSSFSSVWLFPHATAPRERQHCYWDTMDNHGGTQVEENIPPRSTNTRWNWDRKYAVLHSSQTVNNFLLCGTRLMVKFSP